MTTILWIAIALAATALLLGWLRARKVAKELDSHHRRVERKYRPVAIPAPPQDDYVSGWSEDSVTPTELMFLAEEDEASNAWVVASVSSSESTPIRFAPK